MITLPNENAFAATDVSDGLTKREYFAAMAMQGLCAMPDDPKNPVSIKGVAMNAVKIADALIAELNKAEVSNENT